MSAEDHLSPLETWLLWHRYSLQSSPVLSSVSYHYHFTVYLHEEDAGWNMCVQQSEKERREECLFSELRKQLESLGPPLTAAAIWELGAHLWQDGRAQHQTVMCPSDKVGLRAHCHVSLCVSFAAGDTVGTWIYCPSRSSFITAIHRQEQTLAELCRLTLSDS